MTLIERINALATTIASHIKTRSVAPGGTAGQVYTKVSNADYAAGWQTPTGATQADIQRLEAQNWFL